jgi:hypothetical protein
MLVPCEFCEQQYHTHVGHSCRATKAQIIEAYRSLEDQASFECRRADHAEAALGKARDRLHRYRRMIMCRTRLVEVHAWTLAFIGVGIGASLVVVGFYLAAWALDRSSGW